MKSALGAVNVVSPATGVQLTASPSRASCSARSVRSTCPRPGTNFAVSFRSRELHAVVGEAIGGHDFTDDPDGAGEPAPIWIRCRKMAPSCVTERTRSAHQLAGIPP